MDKALPFFSIVLLTLLASPIHLQAQKQGANLLKTDILAVLAHPDDETGMASSLAYYAHGRGATIAHVYATRGEGGGNMVGTHWGPSLGILREVELEECLTILRVKHCFFLDQVDWAYTESASMTLEKWDRHAALGRLVRLIRCLRPEIVLTMNPFPRAGQHGHHQAAGILAVEAFTAAADPTQYPGQLRMEGLQPWQARKLYFRGDSVGPVAKIDAGKPLPDGRNAHEIAGEALRNHRSQGFGRFPRVSLGRPPESFGLIKSVIATSREETDLFAGLPIPPSTPVTVIPPPPAEPREISIAFEPRPALSRFLDWAREQEIAHLMAQAPADLSVIAGQANRLSLTLANPGNQARTIGVAFEGLEGWILQPNELSETLAAGSTKTVPLTLTPPARAGEDVILRATARMGDDASQTTAQTTLHPVPTAPLQRLSFDPALDGTEDGWNGIDPIAITPAQRVQGSTKDSADSSALVRLGYNDTHLFVDIDVKDDAVVSNIAPNDIRGHWRTDAVEICLDPSADSEHTLTCFKVGIFPFDNTGMTRAARDADAHQGPIEETAPGMKVTASRTVDGYRIQTAIPWRDAGMQKPKKGAMLGFNVILYDGDKPDAATGENINESRLAWAPRRGVQGRPEDWGRLIVASD